MEDKEKQLNDFIENIRGYNNTYLLAIALKEYIDKKFEDLTNRLESHIN